MLVFILSSLDISKMALALWRDYFELGDNSIICCKLPMAGIIINDFRLEYSAINIATVKSCQFHYLFFSVFCAVNSIRKLTLEDQTTFSV